jgi:multidrug efflux pump subunit AcrB
LIIALGLLVDDPVIAGDSIKRALAEGNPPVIAAWLGPTELATAIMYATVTNIVAYLPFLLVTGSTGEFLFSLPVVMTVALVASRVVSMTFLLLLGYYLLRLEKKTEESLEEQREHGFFGLLRGRVGHKPARNGTLAHGRTNHDDATTLNLAEPLRLARSQTL